MTFNLRLDHIIDGVNQWPYRVNAVSDKIDLVHPMVMGVQELLPHMKYDLLDRLDNYSAFGEYRFENEEANALFYDKRQVEFIKGDTFWLSSKPNMKYTKFKESACYRICTWAIFEIIDTNKRFVVYNTHLDHISETAREKGIKVILKHMSENKDISHMPKVLMGDFNATPEAHLHQIIEESNLGFKSTYQYYHGNMTTFHQSFNGLLLGETIDYMYINDQIEVHDVNIFQTKHQKTWLSDHFPVMVKVSFE